MRLASALLVVGLTISAAAADEVKPADSKPEATKRKVPFRVVKMLPETRQVLLFDKNRGSHVVAEVGQTIEGYRVDDIDDDEVTLITEAGVEVILAAAAPPQPPVAKPTTAKTPAPVDPYASESPTETTPVDPYASESPAETTQIDPYADPEPPTSPPPANPAATAASTLPALTVASPAPAGAPTPTSPSGPAVIARSELDLALADFGRLAGSFRATFTPDGLRFDAITEGTLLGRIGLRKGDTITTVDNHPLRSLDDAADLYARASTVRNTTIQVVRAGKPVTLRIAIQ